MPSRSTSWGSVGAATTIGASSFGFCPSNTSLIATIPAASIAPAAPCRRRAAATMSAGWGSIGWGWCSCGSSAPCVASAGGKGAPSVVRFTPPTLLGDHPDGYRTIAHALSHNLIVVPEGDVLHRTAAALRTALVGRAMLRFDAPRLIGPRPAPSRVIERVECHGKHLEIVWDDGLVLHSHLRLSGSWHLYRLGERWRRAMTHMRVVIEVTDWVAVCFDAPVVETYREYDRFRHPGFGRLGPDLCTAPDDQLQECARRIADYPDPQATIAEVLLDQHVACGVGNVFRSEVLWACELSPFATVESLAPIDCLHVVNAAARMLRANLHNGHRVTVASAPGGLAVYGRNGHRCARCGTPVQVRRVGEYARALYWCPGCQTRHQPAVGQAVDSADPVMDPHPAAAQYLADLPWRKSPLAAG